MKAVCLDGKIIQITPKVEISDNVCIVSIGKENDFSNIDYIDFEYESDLSKDGDDGYFVLPNAVGTEGGLIFFNDKADMEYGLGPHLMPIFGVNLFWQSLRVWSMIAPLFVALKTENIMFIPVLNFWGMPLTRILPFVIIIYVKTITITVQWRRNTVIIN